MAGIGETIQKDWLDAAERNGLKVHISGIPCLAHFAFEDAPLEMKTLYTRLMLEEGFLANTSIYPTLAHNEEILKKHRIALDKVFGKIAKEYTKGGKEALLECLEGEVCQTDFKRLLK